MAPDDWFGCAFTTITHFTDSKDMNCMCVSHGPVHSVPSSAPSYLYTSYLYISPLHFRDILLFEDATTARDGGSEPSPYFLPSPSCSPLCVGDQSKLNRAICH
ncbi:unnamed protein product [Pleuronectes platessa]|uniref:Uncharacterized protein n=1 Tax=Pleuronectes platessa TaxID=8262 RepID=A0A9N7Z924_PLEPL|nr:unnamed protein product [Pleuronectes platessa]